MDENKYKNIFDAAGKIKRPLLPKGQESTPDISSFSDKELLNLHRDAEINVMLNKMYRMQEHIQTRLNQIFESSGLSANQIKNYLNNPSNFPPDIWQKIQGQRENLEKKIGEVLQIYTKKPKSGHIAKIGSAETKQRKSKTLGARKKWIPM